MSIKPVVLMVSEPQNINKCPSPEVLQEVAERQFSGAGFFAILEHLETCEKCRSQIKLPASQVIMEDLLKDSLASSEPNSAASDAAETPKTFWEKLKQKISSDRNKDKNKK